MERHATEHQLRCWAIEQAAATLGGVVRPVCELIDRAKEIESYVRHGMPSEPSKETAS